MRLAAVSAATTDLSPDKKEAREQLKAYRKEIDRLVRILAAEEKRSVLVILQGMDASGKDGAARRVFTGVNPQYCRVVSFKEPSREEELRDPLWRVYRSAPVKGELCVFNRSQYEDVLVPRARGSLSAKNAGIRLRQIADMERIWSENGVVIRKIFLHISREEQTRRFQSRLDRPEKHWKVKESDFEDRRLWESFQTVYEELLYRTTTKQVLWYIIPADHKWYRDVAIAGVLLAALREMRPRLPKPALDRTRFPL